MRLCFILWLALCCLGERAFSCQLTDDSGRTLSLARPAKRIISLSPDLTETLFAIGAGQQIVGVIQGSDYPLAAKNIPRVGSVTGLDLERIMALHPDLIVTWGHGFSRELTLLKKGSIPVYISSPTQLEDVMRTMTHLGCLTGKNQGAAEAAAHYAASLQALQQQYKHATPVTVFYQVGNYGLITINRESWINQAIELCGGHNLFASAKTVTAEISLEAVILAKPQFILTDEATPHWQDRWQAWPSLPAVKAHHLYALQADLIDRPGPRLVEGVREMCEALHTAKQ